MEYSVIIWYMYMMDNDQLKVISIALSLDIYHLFLSESIKLLFSSSF